MTCNCNEVSLDITHLIHRNSVKDLIVFLEIAHDNGFNDIFYDPCGNSISVFREKKLHCLAHNQPERSKREDSQHCEMRCSEHCGNTVREAQ